MIWTSIKRNKKILIFYLIIILIGFISGLFYANKIKIYNTDYLKQIIDRKWVISSNNIYIVIITIVTTLLYIGPIINAFNAFLEGFSFGLIFLLFTHQNFLKGLIFALLYLISSKLISITIIVVLGIISLKYLFIKENREKLLKYFIYLLSLSLINELILIRIANKICLYFSFLIK